MDGRKIIWEGMEITEIEENPFKSNNRASPLALSVNRYGKNNYCSLAYNPNWSATQSTSTMDTTKKDVPSFCQNYSTTAMWILSVHWNESPGNNKEPYYLKIDSDTSTVDSCIDTLNKDYTSLRSESTFKDRLGELLD